MTRFVTINNFELIFIKDTKSRNAFVSKFCGQIMIKSLRKEKMCVLRNWDRSRNKLPT